MKLLTGGLLFSFLTLPAIGQNGQDWPAISPEELSLKSLRAMPGAPAVMLEYRQVDDNKKGYSSHYARIKILSEAGLRYANVEAQYAPGSYEVRDIRARTVSPDGKSEVFTGEIHDTTVVKVRKSSLHQKTFVLPNVTVGTIVEYSYTYKWEGGLSPLWTQAVDRKSTYGCTSTLAADWQTQKDIFLEHGVFQLVGIKGTVVQSHTVGMRPGDVPSPQLDGGYELEVRDVAPYEQEEYAPPEQTLRTQLKLLYLSSSDCGTESYWGLLAKLKISSYTQFIGNSKYISRETSSLVNQTDTAEAKLRKIYARVQQVRSLSAEASKTQKQQKEEHLKPNENAQEVLEHGYGYANEINLLFVAMVRAAGMEANPVQIMTRDEGTFSGSYLNTAQFNATVVEVSQEGRAIYLDPGDPFCPYGKLSWEKSGSSGMKFANPQSALIPVPASLNGDSVTTKNAELSLDTDGNIRGTVEIVYGLQESMNLKWRGIGEEESIRSQMLESLVQSALPAGAKVKTLSSQGWKGSEEPLRAKFQVELSAYATQAGKHWLFPTGIFHTKDQNPFTAATRTHAIAFDYPYEVDENFTIAIPNSMPVESVPAPVTVEFSVSSYSQTTERDQSRITIKRELKIKGTNYNAVSYPSVRKFFARIHEQDEQPITLRVTN